MTFTKDSELVKVWVGLIMAGIYREDQIPNLSNLRVVVLDVVKATTAHQAMKNLDEEKEYLKNRIYDHLVEFISVK